MTYAYIVAGAIFGAPLRYFLQERIQLAMSSTFPLGTVIVNVTGCFVIGLLLALAEDRSWLSREARLLLVTGFLGSYTTFSSFGWETYALVRNDDVLRAAWYVGLNVVVGLFGVWLGTVAARLVDAAA